MCPGESRARSPAPTKGAPLSRIRTSLHAYPKLLLTLTAAGSAVTAAVITLSGASRGPARPAAQKAAAQRAAHPAADRGPGHVPAHRHPGRRCDVAARDGPAHRQEDARALRLGQAPVGPAGQAVEPGKRLEQLRREPVLGRLRHPAGRTGQQDGQRRQALAQQRHHPDPLGPGLHQEPVRAGRARPGITSWPTAGTDPLRDGPPSLVWLGGPSRPG